MSPTSTGSARAARARRIISSRLARAAATGWPRSPSLAPSAITTRAGRWRLRSSGRRRRPPAVVSPEMLAFTTRQASFSRSMRSPRSADPALARGEAVGGRKAVAEDQHRALRPGGRGREGNQERREGPRPAPQGSNEEFHVGIVVATGAQRGTMNAISEEERGQAVAATGNQPVIVRAEGLTKQVSTPDHDAGHREGRHLRGARRASRSPSSAPRGRASPPCWDCSRASTFPPPGACGSTARTSSRWTRTAARACAGGWWASCSSPSSSCRRSPRSRT